VDSSSAITAIRRASSRVSSLAAERCPSSHSYLLRSRRTIELRSYIKPELGELQVGLARFVHVRVARPFETFIRHDTVLRSRLHGNAHPPPHGDLLPIVAPSANVLAVGLPIRARKEAPTPSPRGLAARLLPRRAAPFAFCFQRAIGLALQLPDKGKQLRRQLLCCLVEISKFSPEPSFGEPPRNRLIACAILRHRHPRLVFPSVRSLSRIVYARGPIRVASRFVCPVAYQPLSRVALNKLRQLGDIRRNPPRLIAREQISPSPHFFGFSFADNNTATPCCHGSVLYSGFYFSRNIVL
jgi:hypothetical protein